MTHKVYKMSFASIYALYMKKVERKGRTKAELDQVIAWLTGAKGRSVEKVLRS